MRDKILGKRWLWIPAMLIFGGVMMILRTPVAWLGFLAMFSGLMYGVMHAPRSPV